MLFHEHYTELRKLGINKFIALKEFARRLTMSQWQHLALEANLASILQLLGPPDHIYTTPAKIFLFPTF